MATYEIIIKNETDSGENPVAGSSSATQKTSGDGAVSNKAVAKKALAVLGTAWHFADKIINHRIQTVELRTGSTEQQERLSFAYSVAKQIGGIAASTALGLYFGSAPGALIGFLTSTASTAISYAQKARELRMQRDLEDIGLKFMNIRAGGSVASYSGSRLKNQ